MRRARSSRTHAPAQTFASCERVTCRARSTGMCWLMRGTPTFLKSRTSPCCIGSVDNNNNNNNSNRQRYPPLSPHPSSAAPHPPPRRHPLAPPHTGPNPNPWFHPRWRRCPWPTQLRRRPPYTSTLPHHHPILLVLPPKFGTLQG